MHRTYDHDIHGIDAVSPQVMQHVANTYRYDKATNTLIPHGGYSDDYLTAMRQNLQGRALSLYGVDADTFDALHDEAMATVLKARHDLGETLLHGMAS